jgi:hypothetical protein
MVTAIVIHLSKCAGQCGRLGKKHVRRSYAGKLIEVVLCKECFAVWCEAWRVEKLR